MKIQAQVTGVMVRVDLGGVSHTYWTKTPKDSINLVQCDTLSKRWY